MWFAKNSLDSNNLWLAKKNDKTQIQKEIGVSETTRRLKCIFYQLSRRTRRRQVRVVKELT